MCGLEVIMLSYVSGFVCWRCEMERLNGLKIDINIC